MKSKHTLSKIAASAALLGLLFASCSALAATPTKVIGFYADSLARPLATSDTTMTLVRGTDYEGRALSGIYAFVIDQGNPSQEVVLGTVSGTAVTGLTRGIDSVSATTTTSADIKAHARGASVNITTFPATTISNNVLTGVESLPLPIYYTSTVSTSTLAQNRANLADWGLVQDTAFSAAGIINATPAAKGVVQIATPLQAASSTGTGSSGATVVLSAGNATSTYNAATSPLQVVVTQNNGKIDPNFIATSSLGLLATPSIGSGGDGALLFDGTHIYSFAATTSSTVYKLSRSVMATDITVSGTITVDTNGYQIFAKGTVSGSGKFRFDGNNGGDAAGSTPGTGGTATGGYFQTTPGSSGANNAAGTAGINVYTAIGPSGVAGGTGSSGAGGAAGVGTTTRAFGVLAADVYTGTTATTSSAVGATVSSLPLAAAGGAGGGGGGNSSSFAGGGGGASGGVVEIIANIISGTWTVEATGGTGGGGGTGAGAGGGGAGGSCAIFYLTNSWTGGCTLTGGTGGTSGKTGTQYLSSITSLLR